MNILKHGSRVTVESYECPDCGCEFISLSTELYKDDDGTQYAMCPECGCRIYRKTVFIPKTEIEERHDRREEIISAILEVLEIDRIHIAMEALHWTWYNTGGVPTEGQIRDEIIRQLRAAWDNKRDFSGGGLEIKYLEADENGNEGLRFKFYFEDCGAFHTEEGNIQYIP